MHYDKDKDMFVLESKRELMYVTEPTMICPSSDKGTLFVMDESFVEEETGLTSEERKEIAAFMIEQWTKWATD